jgi:uncharacterized protein
LYDINAAMFEFYPEKSVANLAKHGIDFVEAQALWDGDQQLNVTAHQGQNGETRSLVIGLIDGKLWSAVVTRRGAAIRIISVRRSRDDEKDLYYGQND